MFTLTYATMLQKRKVVTALEPMLSKDLSH